MVEFAALRPHRGSLLSGALATLQGKTLHLRRGMPPYKVLYHDITQSFLNGCMCKKIVLLID